VAGNQPMADHWTGMRRKHLVVDTATWRILHSIAMPTALLLRLQ
jgi:hypothetical protein